MRRALGYGPLNLFAGSYGTRAAQVFVRAYPHSVRAAYLGSPVPIDVPSALPFAKTEETALKDLFAACAGDAACQAAFPHLRDELRQISAKLDSGGVQVSVPGHVGLVTMNRGRVAEWFRGKLYRPKSAAILPWSIHRAFVGDWAAVVEGILSDARSGVADISFGLFFAITCNEDMAFIREEDVEPETAGTFLGDYRVRQQQAACKPWPKASLAKEYRLPVQSSVPTLLVTGDADGGTPLWYSDRVAQGFSDHRQLVLHGQGHTEWSDCVGKLYQRFIQTGSVRGLDATCPAVPRPPFRTR